MDKKTESINEVVKQLEKRDRERLNPSKVINPSVEGTNPERILEENELSIAGTGPVRDVYELPDGEHVVKFSLADPSENKREIEIWEEAKSRPDIDEHEIICPIVKYHDEYKWMIQKKVKEIDLMHEDWNKIDEHTDYELLKELGAENLDGLEFGWYQDNIVAFDFGE